MSKNQSITFKRRLGGTQGKELSQSQQVIFSPKGFYIFFGLLVKYLNFLSKINTINKIVESEQVHSIQPNHHNPSYPKYIATFNVSRMDT